MTRPLRILDVIPSVDPARGGTVEGLRQSIAALAAAGHVDEVLSLDAPQADCVGAFPARVQDRKSTRLNSSHRR